MRTSRVGVLPLDRVHVAEDLHRLSEMPLVSPYQEFVCGRPSRSLMLWTPGGVAGDGVIAHYDESAEPGLTGAGRALPYLASLLDSGAIGTGMRFARLAVLSGNVLVPHRDYVEFAARPVSKRPSLRLHVPLQTHDSCFFLDDDTAFRMAFGEVWVLDVTRVHGAAVLSDEIRVHLIVDLTGATGVQADRTEIPPERLVERMPLRPEEHDTLLRALSAVVDPENLEEVFAILAKKQYRRCAGPDFFWASVAVMAQRTADAGTAQLLGEMRQHFLQSRSE